MTTYILNKNLIYYASRLNKKDSHAALFGTQFKTSDTANKSSKIDVQYEKTSDEIKLYLKPRCFIENYIYNQNFIYVGALETDWTITESDHEYIKKLCKKNNIIPIFDTPGEYGTMISDILNSDTFNYIHSNLNHSEIYKKYCQFNEQVKNEIGTINDTDVVWAQDYNFIHVLKEYKNTILTVKNFNDLWKCIPFYKLLLDDILEVKSLHFKCENDIKNFEIFVSYTYFPECKKLPNINCQLIGIDKNFIDKIQNSKIQLEKNTILVPYESLYHLICLDKFINKYNIHLKIYLLNISNKKIGQDVLNYLNYLRLKTDVEIVTPETDEEFLHVVSSCQIGFYKSIDEYMKYFGRHVIKNSVYDYDNVADEIYKKLHYIDDQEYKISDINDDIPKILDFIRSDEEIEYKKQVVELPNKNMKIKKQIILNTDESKENTNPSRVVEPTQSNPTQVHIKDLLLDNFSAIILDYDGTLVPLTNKPDECYLSEDTKQTLLELNKRIKVVIVTGRKKEDMDKFIPKELEVFSEHCAFTRKDEKWSTLSSNINFELELRIANFYKERTPGSSVEIKSNGFVFHYRNCDPILGTLQAQKLYTDLIKISPYIKLGKKIIEYKVGSKNDIFKYYKENLIICGDDVTDEDMFDESKGVTIRVGYCENSKAEYYVKDVNEMVSFLKHLI
ncbi:trehalose 6-phosphate phosphatase [Vairimorpha necatrix]|uniref:Trehalose 6-phosphate phosphatase n=1 Tax=Vairimorpha necatrix TaxID=6039 RepID=A0AAX4JCY1_9MICR